MRKTFISYPENFNDDLFPKKRIISDPVTKKHEIFDLHFTPEQEEQNRLREERLLI